MKYSMLILGVCVACSTVLSHAQSTQGYAGFLVEQARANELLRQTAPLVKSTSVPTTLVPATPAVTPLPFSSAQAIVAVADTPTTPEVEAPHAPVDMSVNKLALIIGIDDYKAVNKLRGCVNDAKSMQNLLVTKFQFPPQNVALLTDGAATHEQIVRRFQDHLIANAKTDTIIVFAYAGHGSQMKDTDNEEIDGYDETIVPVDSRQADKFDISDDEINGLFRLLSAKTKNVTFFLDCCHSGGQVRALQLARRVDRDERDPPPPPAYARSEGRPADGKEARFEGRDYALIAGCAADEVAYEYLDSANEQHGTLTYFFVQEVNRFPSGAATYRDIMARVGANVTGVYPSQHPQLEGQGSDQFVFSDQTATQQPFILVNPDILGASLVAGAAQGITVGSVVEVFPPQSREFPAGKGIATLEITDVEAFSAKAKRTDGDTKPIPPQSRAVVRQFKPLNRRLGVHLAGLAAETTAALKKGLESSTSKIDPLNGASPAYSEIFEVVDKPEKAKIIVDQLTAKDFNKIEAALNPFGSWATTASPVVLRSVDGTVLSPPHAASDANLVSRTLGRLAQWARWFQLAELGNPNPTGLKVKFDVQPADGSSWQTAPAASKAGIPAIPTNSRVEFAVENSGNAPVYIAILGLSSDGSVSVAYPPAGDRQSLLPGQSYKSKGTVNASADYLRVRDQYLLVATTKPVDFDFLRQDAARKVSGDLDPLTKVLAGAALTSSRSFDPDPIRSDDWTVEKVTIDIIKP